MWQANQVRQITKLLEEFLSAKEQKPVHLFLKEHFNANKGLGSRDRKNYSRLMHHFFRMRLFVNNLSVLQTMAIVTFYFDENPDPLSEYLVLQAYPEWQELLALPLTERQEIVQNNTLIWKAHPEQDLPFNFSGKINKEDYLKSFLSRPKVFIRMRAGFEDKVKKELQEKSIQFTSYEEMPLCLSMESEIKLDELESRNKGYFEVQDYSSQVCGTYFDVKKDENCWDCCAASGGKSLMLLAKEPGIRLYVTDIRKNILENLQNRFAKAGIRDYKHAVADLSSDQVLPFPETKFDVIIADVPCSGSGTWARTPDVLSTFDEEKLKQFHLKQVNIVLNAATALKPGGKIYYITCSVFEAENELAIKEIESKSNLRCEFMEHILGYDKGADSMFVAVLS